MWGAIKKALNSTLGTGGFAPLDSIDKKESYKSFYNIMAFLQYCTNYFYDKTNEINSVQTLRKDSFSFSDGAKMLILHPDTKIMPQINAFGSDKIWFFPNGFKSLDCVVNHSYSPLRIIEIPETIEFIRSDAFRNLGENEKVIIHKKRGQVSGHPWGHPYESNIFYLEE